MTRTQLCFVACLFAGKSLFSQANFFEILAPAEANGTRNAGLQKFEKASVLRLDEFRMRQYLAAAPLEFQVAGAAPLLLDIPLPNGEIETFGMFESPILSPTVAARHPEIKTYCGNGILNKKAVVRLSFTSSGFDAILLNVGGDAAYFEKSGEPNTYFCYFTKDAVGAKTGAIHTACGVDHRENQPSLHKMLAQPSVTDRNNTGGMLRTYRLAMAANGEFTAQNGGTQASAFAAITGYVNRMNAVYRRELSVHFTLVSDENLIYTNPATDPYDNDDQIAMLAENQTNCDAVIGSGGYDIGHVWGYVGGSGGGIASSSGVCDDGYKGEGVSGEGDLSQYAQVFMDQLLMHEIGHQFAMNHSYNSDISICTTRNPATSVEPGSGATIMSYGFTCDSDDYFQKDFPLVGPILQFHSVSYSEAVAYIANTSAGYGGSCVSNTATGNAAPVVTMPSAFTVPKSTPFALTGSATDAGGGLTYCWEGTNVGTVTPTSATLADLTQPPFFRSYGHADSSGATRYFPLLAKILDGTNYAIGDKLPSVGIATTHRMTVRDNNAAGGGVAFGTVTVTVDGGIGPFLLTSNPSGSYTGGASLPLTWSVNGTNAATTNVKISLSTDGGLTFPTVLDASAPNDGSAPVTLPNTTTSTARIKIEAVGNIFFDISNSNFAIAAALPIELADFTVRKKGERAAQLEWQTASETAFRGFEIEMAAGSGEFRKMGFLNAKGSTSGAAFYRFDVADLAPEHYFFRLKTIDLDGETAFSPIQSLDLTDGQATINVFPNPTRDGLFQIEIGNSKSEFFEVEISNAAGQLISFSTVSSDGQKPFLQLPGSGVFNLKITLEDGKTFNKRVVSLR